MSKEPDVKPSSAAPHNGPTWWCAFLKCR